MVTNYWLKKFKETKTEVDELWVCLYRYENNMAFYFLPKTLDLNVKWSSEEFEDPPVISGVAIFKGPDFGRPLENIFWYQDMPLPITLRKDDIFRYGFNNITINDKWTLADFFTYE